MSTPARLENLADLTPRQRAERLAGADCPNHPGRPYVGCEPCAEKAQAVADRHDREQVLAEAARCWERFPIRYQHAKTDRMDVLKWARQFREDPTNAPSLLLLGATGTGKTFQGYGAVRAAVTCALPLRAGGYRSPRWQALTFADLCASLRPRGRDHDPEAVLDRYRKVELLFIDDLGAAKTTEFVEEATYRLINGRYEDMRPSIFTTNLALSELKGVIGDRIASRLAETCTRVVLEGFDRRRQPRPTTEEPTDG